MKGKTECAIKMEIEGFSLPRARNGGNDSVPVLRTVCAVTLLRCYTFLSIATIGVENKRPLAIETALFLLLRCFFFAHDRRRVGQLVELLFQLCISVSLLGTSYARLQA